MHGKAPRLGASSSACWSRGRAARCRAGWYGAQITLCLSDPALTAIATRDAQLCLRSPPILQGVLKRRRELQSPLLHIAGRASAKPEGVSQARHQTPGLCVCVQDVALTSAFLYMAAAGLLLLLVSAKLALNPIPKAAAAPAPAPAGALWGAAGAAGSAGRSAGFHFLHPTLSTLAMAPAGAVAPAAGEPGERSGAQQGGGTDKDGGPGMDSDVRAGMGLQHGHHRHRRRHHKRHVPAGGGAPDGDRESAPVWCALIHRDIAFTLLCFAFAPPLETPAALHDRVSLASLRLWQRSRGPPWCTCLHTAHTVHVCRFRATCSRKPLAWR